MNIGLCFLVLLLGSIPMLSQTKDNPSPSATGSTGPAAAPRPSMASILPDLDRLETLDSQATLEIGRLRIEKWKAKSDTRSAAQADADSVQRNLTAALPGLIAAVRSAPDDLSAGFKLYRNLNALYDVFGALTESTGAFGPQADYEALAKQLQVIASVRRNLGDALEQLTATTQHELTQSRIQIKTQQQQLAAATAAPERAAVAQAEAPKKPAPKKKTAPKKPAAVTSNPNSPSGSSLTTPAGTAPTVPKP